MEYAIPILFVCVFVGAAVLLMRRKRPKEGREDKSVLTLEYRSPLSVAECLDRLGDVDGDDIFEYTFGKRNADGRYVISFTAILRYYHPCGKSSFFVDLDDGGDGTVITMTTVRPSDKMFASAYMVEMDEFIMTKVEGVRLRQ